MTENNKKFVTINETLVAPKNSKKKMDENEYISRKNYISNQYKMASVSYGMLFCLIGVVLTYYF